MASISFTCPHCNKVLRTNSRPPAGKKVKCPACGDPFVPKLPEEEEATKIQEKPAVKARAPKREADADPDEAPRRRKPSRDDEDEDEKPRAKRSRRDDEDEDEDEKPRTKKKRDADDDGEDGSIKKKKKKKSGSMMWMMILLVLFGGGSLLGCAACGVGAFVWPGFLNPKTDLAAFVAPDANMVFGGNPKMMRTKMAKLEDLFRKQGMMMGQPKNKLDDVSLNSERMLAFGNLKDPERSQVIVFQSNTIDVLKVKNNPALSPAQTVAGHANVHVQNAGALGNGLPRFLAFAGNDVIVMSEQSQDALIAALTRAKQPKQNNAALELAKSVEKSPFWMAIIPDAQSLAEMSRGLEAGAGGGGPMGQAMPPSLRNAAPAIGGIKGITIALDANAASDLTIRASVACKNADDAGKLKTACDDGFGLMKTGLKEMEKFQPAGGQPLVPPSLIVDLNSIAFSAQGSNVSVDLKFSSATIEEFAKLGNGMQGGFPGRGPIGNNNFGPPKVVAFKDLTKKGGKGFPMVDGGPKVGIPKGPANVQIWTANAIAGGKHVERTCQFTQGKLVTVDVEGLVSQKGTRIAIVALRGDAGENLVPVERGVADNIRFTVPATDTYRIRVRNTGKNLLNGFSLRITEQ